MVWNLYENESENKCLECPGIRDMVAQEKHISLLFNFSALNKFESVIYRIIDSIPRILK